MANIKDDDHLTDTGAESKDTVSSEKGREQATKGGSRRRRKNKKSDENSTSSQQSSQSGNSGVNSPVDDLSVFMRNPELLLPASQVQFVYKPGMVLQTLSNGVPTTNAATFSRYSVNQELPGVRTMNWIPSIGQSLNGNDPINVVGREMYSSVREVYSGRLVANAQDFVMYMMAGDSIFAYITKLKKIFRLIDAATTQNYAIPVAILKSQGFTDAQMQQLKLEKELLWSCINTLIHSTEKFFFPSIIDIMKRHVAMNEDSYLDAPSLNAQIYDFNMMYAYQYDPTIADYSGTENAGGLSLVATSIDYFDTQPGTAYGDLTRALFNVGNNMILALINWDDSYQISGYLTRAYPNVPSFQIPLLGYDEPYVPVYSPVVLAQIENSFGVGRPRLCIGRTSSGVKDAIWIHNLEQFQIKQNVAQNSLVQQLNNMWLSDANLIALYEGSYTWNSLISIRSDAPTPLDVVNATRMHNAFKMIGTGKTSTLNYVIAEITCATEFIVGWSFEQMMFDVNNSGFSYPSGSAAFIRDVPLDTGLQQFDWHPCAMTFSTWGGNYNSKPYINVRLDYGMDYHNVGFMTQLELAELNRVCLLSVFGAYSTVPGIRNKA